MNLLAPSGFAQNRCTRVRMPLNGIPRREDAMVGAHGGYLEAASVSRRGKMVKLLRIAAFTALLSAPALGQAPRKAGFPTFAAPGKVRVNWLYSVQGLTRIILADRMRARRGITSQRCFRRTAWRCVMFIYQQPPRYTPSALARAMPSRCRSLMKRRSI